MLDLSRASDLTRYAQPAALTLTVLLAAALLFSLANLLRVLLPGEDPVALAARTPTAQLIGAAQPGRTALSVAKWHLFGNATLAIDPSTLQRDAPETALQLKLRGTLAERDPNAGMAMIADGNGIDHVYRVGDTLPGGAKLHSVYPDRVMLENAGALEALNLPRPDQRAPGAAAAPGAVSLPGSAPTTQPFINPVAGSAAANWAAAQQQFIDNPEELAKRVTVLPVMENGKFAGVRLSAGRDAALLNKLGLLPADIVTAVNGIPLDSPARGQQIFDTVKNSRSLSVTVRRDGKDTTLNVNLK